MKVIFNADDFGLSKGVNLGILEACKNGPVRSTSIMANMPRFEHAVELSKEVSERLKIGVHLTLSRGKSVGGVYKTLTDQNGEFLHLTNIKNRANRGDVDLAEVEAEYEAQIQKVLSAGIKPDHLDSHHLDTHQLPSILMVLLKLAKKYGIKSRKFHKELFTGEYADIKTTDIFDKTFFDETATKENLLHILSTHKQNANSLEIMCHPAFIDAYLHSTSSYSIQRVYELDILTSPEVMDFIAKQGIELCSFSDL